MAMIPLLLQVRKATGLCHIRPFTGYITAAQQEPWLRIPPPGRDRC